LAFFWHFVVLSLAFSGQGHLATLAVAKANSVARWRFSKPNLGRFGVFVLSGFLNFFRHFGFFLAFLAHFKKKCAYKNIQIKKKKRKNEIFPKKNYANEIFKNILIPKNCM
jgi:hypothetical protein